METINNDMTNNLTNDEWTFLIYLLLMEDQKQRSEIWEQFENDLTYKNRFSSDSLIVSELKKRAKQATTIIPKKTVFYRARSFKHSSFDKLVRYYMKENGYSNKQITAALEDKSYSEKLVSILPILYGDVDADYPNLGKTANALFAAQRKWKRYVKFKGYSAADSGAPQADLVNNGRVNPDHIRYLYLCEDEITPVYEIRPIIGERVSVAKFSLQTDVKVYDLTLDIQDRMENSEYEWPSLYNTIGIMFSRPYNGENRHYLPTQFLAEEIKRMGFDGLRFNSSLHKGGINVVLFNPDVCKAISSELRNISEIKIKIDDPLIYLLDPNNMPNNQVVNHV